MPIDFLDIDYKIESNERALKNHSERFEAAANKITLIGIIYTVLSVYSANLFQYALKFKFTDTAYSIGIILLGVLLVISVFFTFLFLKTQKIKYPHSPQFFYSTIKDRYTNELHVTGNLLNEYIKTTYLKELEKAEITNFKAVVDKRKRFNYAFNLAMLALLPYFFCTVIYLEKNSDDKIQKVIVTNIDSSFNLKDTLLVKTFLPLNHKNCNHGKH